MKAPLNTAMTSWAPSLSLLILLFPNYYYYCKNKIFLSSKLKKKKKKKKGNKIERSRPRRLELKKEDLLLYF